MTKEMKDLGTDYCKMFKEFCGKAGINFDFTLTLNGCSFVSNETRKAFRVWSHATGEGQ